MLAPWICNLGAFEPLPSNCIWYPSLAVRLLSKLPIPSGFNIDLIRIHIPYLIPWWHLTSSNMIKGHTKSNRNMNNVFSFVRFIIIAAVIYTNNSRQIWRWRWEVSVLFTQLTILCGVLWYMIYLLADTIKVTIHLESPRNKTNTVAFGGEVEGTIFLNV